MKTLTLTQPWASLVVAGEKRWETRSWQTRHRGPLAIHAAKGFPREARRLCLQEPFASCLRRMGYGGLALADPARALPLGQVLGKVDVIDCVAAGDIAVTSQELAFGDFTAGRFAWLLGAPYRFASPLPARGALGLWEWEQPL